jgi:uncharacterized SAM-dependent methyltransferase
MWKGEEYARVMIEAGSGDYVCKYEEFAKRLYNDRIMEFVVGSVIGRYCQHDEKLVFIFLLRVIMQEIENGDAADIPMIDDLSEMIAGWLDENDHLDKKGA